MAPTAAATVIAKKAVARAAEQAMQRPHRRPQRKRCAGYSKTSSLNLASSVVLRHWILTSSWPPLLAAEIGVVVVDGVVAAAGWMRRQGGRIAGAQNE